MYSDASIGELQISAENAHMIPSFSVELMMHARYTVVQVDSKQLFHSGAEFVLATVASVSFRYCKNKGALGIHSVCECQIF
jgi:hypothetical protein